jgi:hypothetical protein
MVRVAVALEQIRAEPLTPRKNANSSRTTRPGTSRCVTSCAGRSRSSRQPSRCRARAPHGWRRRPPPPHSGASERGTRTRGRPHPGRRREPHAPPPSLPSGPNGKSIDQPRSDTQAVSDSIAKPVYVRERCLTRHGAGAPRRQKALAPRVSPWLGAAISTRLVIPEPLLSGIRSDLLPFRASS